ncbi:DNA-binding transcriptional regulator, FrmR family, partial [Dysosmobacter welbionis]
RKGHAASVRRRSRQRLRRTRRTGCSSRAWTQTPSGRKPAWSGRRTMAGGSLLTPPRRRRMMAAERQISKEAQTMAKTPPFEEFMEKMYGGGK